MKIYIPEPYAMSSVARLRVGNRFEIVDALESADILLIRSQTRVDAALLKETPNLKLVVTATSGFDHIDWRACRERNIVVSHTPDANAQSTAELTIFLMMALLRNTLTQLKSAREGLWRKNLARGEALEGKTLGIVGLGRVGRRVARLAKALEMKVVGYDPYIEPVLFQTLGVERLAYVELLRASDIVTFHVPLTRETKHMINHATLEEISNSAYIINASRGAVIDESEALVGLRENRLAGVAFDVLEKEPPAPGNDLLRHPKAIVTPHVGAFTEQAFENASNMAVDRAFWFAEGKALPDTLPLNTPWFMVDDLAIRK